MSTIAVGLAVLLAPSAGATAQSPALRPVVEVEEDVYTFHLLEVAP